MRPIYFILRIALPYIYSVFFRRRKVLNYQWKFYRQAIFVSNHPSAFLDPLLVANEQISVIHFMTRSDVFKPWLKPVTWAAHMVPIYRTEQDGSDSREKNKEVFRGVQKILRRKRSLIMFGEGYTDDVFIRRLKPLKKGPGRIGFGTMDASDWELDIKIIPVGVNYTNPGVFRSDVLTSYGKEIYLKDYKEIYDDNPNKAITKLIRDLDVAMKENLTHVNDKELAEFLEHILILNRKGMNWENFEKNDSLEKRFRYTQNAAININENFSEDSKDWTSLRKRVADYVKLASSKGLEPVNIHRIKNGKSGISPLRYLFILIGLPFAILGALHCFIPYIAVKKMVENMFRRKVFWSGVKILLGAFFAAVINLPIIWLFHSYVYESYWLALLYYFVVPGLTFVIGYNWIKNIKQIVKWNGADKSKISDLVEENKELHKKLDELGF